MILTLLLIIIYISFISLGLPDSLLGSTWPAMYGDFAVPISYAGITSMIVTGGTVISGIFSDRIIRRFGTGPVTAVSVFMTAVALFGFSVSGNFIVLCLWAIPLGLGAGSVDTALNNYVALHYKAKHMSWLHCFWGLGATAGPVIMSFSLVNLGSWNSGYVVISIIQISLVAILFVSLPLWKKVSANNGHSSGENGVSYKFVDLFKIPGVKHALLCFFFYCSLEMTVGLWGSSYLVLVRDIPKDTAAAWISLYYFGITFGRFVSGFLTLKLNNLKMIYLGLSVIALGIIVVMNFSPQAAFFLIGLGCAPVFPSLIHDTPVSFGSEYSQSIIGLQMAGAYVGSAVMPPLFGLLASYFGYGFFVPYIFTLMLLLIITVKSLYFTVKKKHSS